MIAALLLFAQAPIDFADYLYNQGDYRRAALEYERIGFALADTSTSSYALLKAGSALLKAGDAGRAEKVFEFGARNLPSIPEFHYGLLRAEFALADYDAVGQLAQRLDATRYETQGAIYHSFVLALQGRPDSAARKLSTLPGHPLIDETVSLLNTPLKHRSPWLSAGFSTLLPGAGQVYCGRWGDAWQSFSITAVFAGAALYYFVFSPDTTAGNTVKGVVTASLGGLFWLGNVYGAANAALDYNDFEVRKRETQLGNLLDRFELEPEIKRP